MRSSFPAAETRRLPSRSIACVGSSRPLVHRPRIELQGDACCSGGDIEHGCRFATHDPVDHLPPPAVVLAKRQKCLEPVVALRQRREELLGEPAVVTCAL